MPTTRWKWVQLTGRLARRSDEQGIFISVIPEKQRIRGNFISGNMTLNTFTHDQLVPWREKNTIASKLQCHLEPASTEGFMIPSRSLTHMVR